MRTVFVNQRGLMKHESLRMRFLNTEVIVSVSLRVPKAVEAEMVNTGYGYHEARGKKYIVKEGIIPYTQFNPTVVEIWADRAMRELMVESRKLKIKLLEKEIEDILPSDQR